MSRSAAIIWMERHPEVLELFERFALALAAKRKRFGINLIRERVRWEIAFDRRDDDYKINNSHAPYIARMLIARHPHLADCLELRRTRT